MGTSRYELVAGGEQRNPGPGSDEQTIMSECRGDPDVDAGQGMPWKDHAVPAADVRPEWPDARSLWGCDLDEHRRAVAPCVLLAYHGVRALRHRRAGHDPHSGASDVSPGHCSCSRFADDREWHRIARACVRDVTGADRVSVHGGVVEPGKIRLRGDSLRKDPPKCRIEADRLRYEHVNLVEQAPLCSGD